MHTLLEQVQQLVPLAAAATEGRWKAETIDRKATWHDVCSGGDSLLSVRVGDASFVREQDAVFTAAARNLDWPALAAALSPTTEEPKKLDAERRAHYEKVLDGARDAITYDGSGGTDLELLSQFDKVVSELLAVVATTGEGQQWIAVAERLPEPQGHDGFLSANCSKYVLVRHKWGEYHEQLIVAYYDTAISAWMHEHDAEDWEVKDVTHWMPLPATPIAPSHA